MHTDKIEIVNQKKQNSEPDICGEQYPKTDGLITQKKDIIITTTSADCILMIFFDPITKTIANIHSGWRGTYQQISSKTVQKMKEKFNVKPENLICCMCPSIRKCHFEVRKDVKDMFSEKFKYMKEIEEIIEESNKAEEKWYIDTILLNKIMMYKQGLKPENVVDSKICTVCNNRILHSYRADKLGYGLETAIITLSNLS